jgi:hypothetical protein
MALFFDTDVDEAADDALQVVDLDDILMDGVDESSSSDEVGKGSRAPRRRVTRLAVAGAIVLVVAAGGVAAMRYLQSDRDGSQVDIEDRDRELPDLPPPTSEPQPPQQSVDTTAPPTTGPTAPVTETDPEGKAAFKAARGVTPPATQPTGPATTAPPATTPSTVPPTTATTIDTTSITLPDGSPNPYGPGPNGPPTGPATTAPDPWGPDLTIPGG